MRVHKTMRYNIRHFSLVITSVSLSTTIGLPIHSIVSTRSHCFGLSRWFSTTSSSNDIKNEFNKVQRMSNYSLESSVESICGRRPYMEDEYVLSKDNRLAVVLDGHGGKEVAQYAKQRTEAYFNAIIKQRLQQQPALQQILPWDSNVMDAFKITTRALDSEVGQHKVWNHRGCTFCGVYVNRDDDIDLRKELADIDLDSELKGLLRDDKEASASVSPSPAAVSTNSVPASFDGEPLPIDQLIQGVESAKPNSPYSIISCNIGDSRAVLSRRGQAIELTQDHKPDAPEEKARIEKLGGYIKWHGKFKYGKPDPDTGVYRVNGNLALSRALGDHAERPCVSSTPDIVATPGDWEGDEFIIIATDGLWDVFSSKVAVQFVNEVMKIAYEEDEHLRKGGEMKLPPELKEKEREMNAQLEAEAKAIQDELDQKMKELEAAVESGSPDSKLSEEEFTALESRINDLIMQSTEAENRAAAGVQLTPEETELAAKFGSPRSDIPVAKVDQPASSVSSDDKQDDPMALFGDDKDESQFEKLSQLPDSMVATARKNMAKYLTMEAHRQGSSDNISVIVLWLKDMDHLEIKKP